jgi:hypothetical protein
MAGTTGGEPATSAVTEKSLPGAPGEELPLHDLAGLDAAGADADALGRAIHNSLDRLQIHIPAATRYVVRVRNVVTKLRAFAAKLTYLCHDLTPVPWRKIFRAEEAVWQTKACVLAG